MLSTSRIWGSLAGVGLLLGITSNVVAQIPVKPSEPTTQFRQIEQPLGLKVGITLGGVALIGLELWWFLLNKSRSKQK